MSTPSHYKVLQVDPEAEHEVIQAAYRRLARKYHPDLAADAQSADRMAAINAAWAVLGDPASRARYDAERRRASGAAHGATAPVARTFSSASDAPPPPPATGPRATWGGPRQAPAAPAHGAMGATAGHGEAGQPPGNPSGSVINFGRYAGWSLGEIARRDLEFLEWLDRMPIGRPYRNEIDRFLRSAGRRASEVPGAHGSQRQR